MPNYGVMMTQILGTSLDNLRYQQRFWDNKVDNKNHNAAMQGVVIIYSTVLLLTIQCYKLQSNVYIALFAAIIIL